MQTNLDGANLTGCHVYGISVWNASLYNATQSNLLITPEEEPAIQVDDLEVAQFVYLLLSDARIRHVIDTITSKVVLILGRFTPDRKVVLDAIRDELRKRDYVPVLIDFVKPSGRDFTETVRTLAHVAPFVIADITDAKSIPRELMSIVPNLPSVPVHPLLLASQREYGMFEQFRRFPWVWSQYSMKTTRLCCWNWSRRSLLPPRRGQMSIHESRSLKSRQTTSITEALKSLPRREAGFIEPTECVVVPQLPEGSNWDSPSTNIC